MHRRGAVRFHAGGIIGTTDAIFAARQVIEKHREMQTELHMVFIDLEKIYDKVARPLRGQEFGGGRLAMHKRFTRLPLARTAGVLGAL